jgi:hypothetical protein
MKKKGDEVETIISSRNLNKRVCVGKRENAPCAAFSVVTSKFSAN